MEILLNPGRARWEELTNRPSIDRSELEASVKQIMKSVRESGDDAIRSLSAKYDGSMLADLKVSSAEIDDASACIPEDLQRAILVAKNNIEEFHSSQLKTEEPVITSPGVSCWRKSVAIEKVGLYIPGGSAPLFSTVLMLAIPAKLAGCSRIILCSPAGRDGMINPLILHAARLTGVTDIFRVGGAQAIAAMTYGTESIPAVYKIFGPGNQYVTKAKELAQLEGVAIDMPAGPSEVLVIADSSADPAFVAADLLSQAEHGPDSQVIMATDSHEVLMMVKKEIDEQLSFLPRRDIASKALQGSRLIQLASIGECLDFSNMYAPEHLILNCRDAKAIAEKVVNAGSVFLGQFSCESAGDYASGTNHTLPTNGYARNFSGVSVDSFVRKITFQELSQEGLKNIGPAIELMAEAESLSAHRNAVDIRLKSLRNG